MKWDSIIWNSLKKCFMFIEEDYSYDNDVDLIVNYIKESASDLTYYEARTCEIPSNKVFAVPSFIGNFISFWNKRILKLKNMDY